MEKDNKSVPMRVFSNTMSNNYTIETKTTNATTSILQNVLPSQATHRHQQHPHAIHSRLTDIQMCPISSNEIIDLTTASTSPTTVAMVNVNAMNLNSLTNMMSIYDVNNSVNMVNNFVEISPSVVVTNANNLDILKGISKGSCYQLVINLLRISYKYSF